jgi:hypothetical protein
VALPVGALASATTVGQLPEARNDLSRARIAAGSGTLRLNKRGKAREASKSESENSRSSSG